MHSTLSVNGRPSRDECVHSRHARLLSPHLARCGHRQLITSHLVPSHDATRQPRRSHLAALFVATRQGHGDGGFQHPHSHILLLRPARARRQETGGSADHSASEPASRVACLSVCLPPRPGPLLCLPVETPDLVSLTRLTVSLLLKVAVSSCFPASAATEPSATDMIDPSGRKGVNKTRMQIPPSSCSPPGSPPRQAVGASPGARDHPSPSPFAVMGLAACLRRAQHVAAAPEMHKWSDAISSSSAPPLSFRCTFFPSAVAVSGRSGHRASFPFPAAWPAHGKLAANAEVGRPSFSPTSLWLEAQTHIEFSPTAILRRIYHSNIYKQKTRHHHTCRHADNHPPNRRHLM
jgi:hypothetical protein